MRGEGGGEEEERGNTFFELSNRNRSVVGGARASEASTLSPRRLRFHFILFR